MELIAQCRSSGLTGRQWCIENGIPVSTFYYHVRALSKKPVQFRKKGGQSPLWETEQNPSDPVALPISSACLEMQGIRVENHEQAGANVIRNTLLALRQLC